MNTQMYVVVKGIVLLYVCVLSLINVKLVIVFVIVLVIVIVIGLMIVCAQRK